MALPIARTEPLCFSHVGGCSIPASNASPSSEGRPYPKGWAAGIEIGGAKMGVGDRAASCELKALIVPSGPHSFRGM